MITTFVFTVSAQEYRSFPTSDDHPLWVIKTTFPYIENNDEVYCHYLGMIGDTVIHSKEYNKIYYLSDTMTEPDYITDYYGALREELKKIYVVYPDEEQEKLVFDFAKVMNDTILFDSTRTPPAPVILSVTDTILLHDSSYIRYTTSCGDRWIEGIGNTEWTIFDICPPLPDNGSYTRLSCFKMGNTIIYGENCECGNTILQLPETACNNYIEMYPNPASDYLVISCQNSADIGSYSIQIFDVTGKIMFEHFSTNENKFIPLDNIYSGVYIVRITSRDFIYSNTLIIEKN